MVEREVREDQLLPMQRRSPVVWGSILFGVLACVPLAVALPPFGEIRGSGSGGMLTVLFGLLFAGPPLAGAFQLWAARWLALAGESGLRDSGGREWARDDPKWNMRLLLFIVFLPTAGSSLFLLLRSIFAGPAWTAFVVFGSLATLSLGKIVQLGRRRLVVVEDGLLVRGLLGEDRVVWGEISGLSSREFRVRNQAGSVTTVRYTAERPGARALRWTSAWLGGYEVAAAVRRVLEERRSPDAP
jgi:hypothetical protein